MGVGRSTVREGLRLLQAKGLVEINHGVGTFVAAERIPHTSGIVFSFSETILARGMTPHSEVLQQEIKLADQEIANKLKIEITDQVNILKRLRFADDIPMALETTISALKRFPDLLQQDWNGNASLYAFLQERYQSNPTTSPISCRLLQRHLHKANICLFSQRVHYYWLRQSHMIKMVFR